MNRAFIFLTTLAVLILLGGQSIAKTQKPSEEMIQILVHYKSGPNDLDVKKLPLDKTMDFPSKKEMPEYEVYNVPCPDGWADYFGYRVYLHNKSGRHWIHQSGGVGGASNFYGPGLVKDLNKL
ncbi:MAG: hypothetical protein K9N47_00695 [Prosthecobacter sp.]|uniref:hypothetical protein n=1 Tax=Prosthecobacter sp. TaxID=1965333 RepID=UPI0025FC2373|nr:hypothetical protein [Prosthecobacter sp.]MCF7784603.1 hypothetical protein [Prosthecobacter sp.]